MNTDQFTPKRYTKIRGMIFEIVEAVRIYKPEVEIVDRVVLETSRTICEKIKTLMIQIVRWNQNNQEVWIKINNRSSAPMSIDQVDEWIDLDEEWIDF